MIRSTGQPAASSPRVMLPVPAPSSSTGPGRAGSTSRAIVAATGAPLGQMAAICSGLRNHSPKNNAVSAIIGWLPRRSWGALYQLYVTAFLHPDFVLVAGSVAKRSSTVGRGSLAKRSSNHGRQPMLLTNLTAGFCVITTGAHLATVAVAGWRCGRSKRAIRPPAVPAISLLRPVCGDENLLAETLGSSFRLDHPDYEILFCAARQDDPAVPVVRRLLAANPEATAQPLIGGGGDA